MWRRGNSAGCESNSALAETGEGRTLVKSLSGASVTSIGGKYGRRVANQVRFGRAWFSIRKNGPGQPIKKGRESCARSRRRIECNPGNALPRGFLHKRFAGVRSPKRTRKIIQSSIPNDQAVIQ